jgi:endonuclease YncB( thermonuclease family)
MQIILWSSPLHADFTATVQRITDGDTIVVRTADFEDVKVRLYGIDAPERKQPGGAEASAWLRPLQGQTVTVIEMDVDRYGRTVALVESEGRSVNVGIVAAGWAWHYDRYCKAAICGDIEAAENAAREAGRGIWAGEAVPPWEWRRR